MTLDLHSTLNTTQANSTELLNSSEIINTMIELRIQGSGLDLWK